MLVWFRENRGRVVHFFVWPLIVVFIALYGSSQLTNRRNMNQLTAVRVNGERVPRSEYLAASEQVRQRYTDLLIKPEKSETEIALEQVIKQALASQLANDLGLYTPNETVNDVIVQQMTGPTGFFNEDGYKYFLRQSGYESHDVYQNVIRKQLDLNLALNYVRGTAVPSEDEIQRTLDSQKETRTAEMIGFPSEDYLDQVDATTDELKQYFEEHKERYRFPKRMKVDYVMARPSEYIGEATPDEESLERWFRSEREKFLIPPERDVAAYVFSQEAFTDKVTFTEEELKTQYEETKERYSEPEKFKAKFLAVSVEVPDASIEAKMDENPDDFLSEKEAVATRHILIRTTPNDSEETLAQKKAQIEEIRSRIKTVDDFIREAKAYSDDTSNAEKGGDLGYTQRGRLVPEYESVAYTIQSGTVSEPVKTQFGFHLIWKYGEREAGERISPQEARLRLLPEIDSTPLKRAAREKLNQAIASLGDSTLADATQVDGLEVYETDWFSRGDSPHPKAARDRYPFYQAISKINAGQTTDIIEGFASFFVAELIDKQDSRQQDFEEVRSEVESALRTKKASEMARKAAQEAADLIRAGSLEFEGVAEKYGLSGPTEYKGLRNPSGEQRAENRVVDREIVNRAFTTDEGEVEGPFDTLAGSTLMKVTAVHEERLPELEDVHDEVAEQYRAKRAERLAREKVLDVWYDLDRYDDSLKKAAEVHHFDVETSDFFQPGEPVPGFPSNSVVRYAAIGLRVEGATSTLLEDPLNLQNQEQDLPKEAFYLLQADEIQETRLPEFSEVVEKVRNDLKLEKAAALAKEEATKARDLIAAQIQKATAPLSASRSLDLKAFAEAHNYKFIAPASIPLGPRIPS
ncbi:MAG: peptidylprolyl isomerase, partial [Candidatus Omnitrophica bacterium]|nr:peptidylprolyl isomerase [Candidatus Omnitrophota bacterium]